MLIYFIVKNYRSFKDYCKLTFEVSGEENNSENVVNINNYQLVKDIVIYGKNGSGKSNLLRALANFINFVYAGSNNLKEEDYIELNDTFRLSSNSFSEPSEFEIKFSINNDVYIYKVILTSKKIIEETLINKGIKNDKILFSINNGKLTEINFKSKISKEIEKIFQIKLNNQLLLSKLFTFGLEINNVAQFFKRSNHDSFEDKFSIPAKGIGSYIIEELGSPQIINSLKKDKDKFKFFNLFLKASDLGISEITFDESKAKIIKDNINDNEKDGFFDPVFSLIIHHKSRENFDEDIAKFHLYLESKGTLKLISVLDYVYEKLKTGGLIIYDEFSKDIHPDVLILLLKLIRSDSNKFNTQIIFTTHNTSLINFQTFRKDQIWITDKNYYGESNLKRLSEFSGLDNSFNFDKLYRSGKLGGVPQFKEFIIEEIKEMFNK